MDWKVVLAFAGWLLAISQFIFNYREIRRKNDSELLEKTLGYFDKGSLSRSIAISLEKLGSEKLGSRKAGVKKLGSKSWGQSWVQVFHYACAVARL